MSCAGLVPVMALAEQAGLSELLANKIHIAAPRVKSGSANPAPKLATLIASMLRGRGLHRRCRPGPGQQHENPLSPGVCPVNGGNAVAGVHFRSCPPVERIRCWPSIWPGLCERVNLLPGAQAGPSSTSIRWCARSTDTPSRAPPTGIPKSLASRSYAKDSHRWSPPSAPTPRHPWSPGSGYAPGKPTPVRARPAWSPRRSPPPARPG